MAAPSQETLLLVADYLERCTPCSGAAAALRADVETHGLLGTQKTMDGAVVPVTVKSALAGGALAKGLLERRLVAGLDGRRSVSRGTSRTLADGTLVFSDRKSVV